MNENIIALYESGKIGSIDKQTADKFCSMSRIGEYKCLVKTRYGFCCDLCLEDEILLLRSKGIHTVGCCCGHGNEELSYIQTVSENSKKMMEDMGYKQTNIKPVKGDAWFPKSNLLYDKGGSK
jgi:hypothetical protein